MQYAEGNTPQHGQDGRCPWCGNDGLGFWEKQTLGPLIPKKCHACGHGVRASWPSTLASIAMVLVPFAAAAIAWGEAAGYAGLALGGAAAMFWQARHLRLLPHTGRSPQG